MLAGRRESMGEPRPDILRAQGGWATAMGVHSCFSNVCGVLRESPLARGDRALRFSAADRGSTVPFGTVVGCAAGVYGFHMPVGGRRPKPPGQAVTRNPRL